MALSSFEELLIQKRIDPQEIVTRKVYAERLGEIEISFKRLSYRDYKMFKQQAISRKRGDASFDMDKYRNAIILNCITDPDLSKKEVQEAIGAIDDESALQKLFLAGEIVGLGDLILSESGFDQDPFRDILSDDEESSSGEGK